MPKARRERSVSFDRSRVSPFPCSSSRARESSLPKNPLEDDKNIKEWEDARCPVCMEHPHNAILLLCSSHEKGCRPFMCDTSYRHSNCFDQFRKSFGEATPIIQRPGETPISISISPVTTSVPMLSESRDGEASTPEEKPKLVCPLCRGVINGCVVVESARRFMNSKSRSCASETCDFSGTYTDLRKHARLVHPLVRPTQADPERQRNWRRLERQRDLGDLLSTLNSSFGDERIVEDSSSTLTIDDGGWLTVFFLVRFIRPGSSSGRSSSSRTRAQIRRSRRLWGESDEGEPNSRDHVDESSDSGQSQATHYERRQRRRSTPEN